MSRRLSQPVADLMEAGWLPPGAAAERMGITVRQLEARCQRGELKRREVAPNTGIYLYEVPRS